MRVDYSCTSDSSATAAAAAAPIAAASLAPRRVRRVAPVLALVCCLVATSYVRPLHTIVFSVEAV